MLTGLLFALAAAVLNSAAGLLQSDATSRVSRQRQLITQPRYLAGLFGDALGWGCTVVALRHLPVFVVHGVLGASIALTALAARFLYRSVLRPMDHVAIGFCLVGLVMVTASADPEPSSAPPTAYTVLFAACVVMGVAMVALWRGKRAWPLAIIAGLGLGGSSLGVRAFQVDPNRAFDLAELLSQPAVYLVICFWAIGMLSYTRALGLGGVARVTAVFGVTEVIVPGLAGIALLNDTVRSGWQPCMAIGLLLAAAGVIVLARLPAHQPPQPARVR